MLQQQCVRPPNSVVFIDLPVSPREQCATESTPSVRTFILTADPQGRTILRTLDCCETASPNAAMSGMFLPNKTEKETHEPRNAISELDSWNYDS
jgi:hypothetical protein